MTATFYDRQDTSNPMNGASIGDTKRLLAILRGMSNRPPFFGELLAENGFNLLIGIGKPVGCAQYSNRDGTPPYLMAVSDRSAPDNHYVDFLIGNEPSPVPWRYCLPCSQIEEIAAYFVQTGAPSPVVDWEEI